MRHAATIGLGIMVALAAPAQAAPADLRERVDAYLASAWPADGPGVAVIVTENGRTVYTGLRGLADVEARTPVTAQTVFRLGSITKQFTAAVILQLVDEGRISLADPVSRFLPDYPQPGAGATVAQLLNHTVGIQSYTGIPGWMVEANTNRAYTTDQLVAVFRDQPAPSRPGERWNYNNSGYVLLGAIIESVTGMPWHQSVEQRITRRLGLATIRYGVDEPAIAAMADGYSRGPNGIQPANRIHMSVPHAAGALVGTVGDLARWADALHHGRVVSADSYRRMIAPTGMVGGSNIPYGFGLNNTDIRRRRGLDHSGGIFGFSTDSVFLPEQNLFVAVFTNSDAPSTGPSLAMRRIAAIALGDPYPSLEQTPLDMATVEPFLGVYAVPGGGERRLLARDGKLFTQRTGGGELEVFAAGEGRYFYGPASLTWFTLTRDESGQPVMDMHQNGEDRAERSRWSGPIPAAAAAFAVPRAQLEAYVGTYQSPIGAVTIALGESDRLTAQLAGQPMVGLRATAAHEFAVEGIDARIVFHGANGTIDRLVIHQGGRELPAPRTAAAPAS